MKPASSHENISQMINFMARQEQQIKTKFLYFIKTYRFCGFSYKKIKIERNCRVDSWSILLLMVYPDGLVFGWTRKTSRSSINYHCFTDNRAEIAQWEHLLHGWTFVFANLLRKFRFSLLITGTGGVIFFNPIQLQT